MVAEMGRPREGVRERCAIGAHDGGRGTQRQAPSACAVCTGSGGTPRNEAIHAVLFSCPPVKTMAPSSSSPSSAEETSRAGRAPERRDRAHETASEPQAEATRAAETGAPTRNRVRNTPRESASGAAGQDRPLPVVPSRARRSRARHPPPTRPSCPRPRRPLQRRLAAGRRAVRRSDGRSRVAPDLVGADGEGREPHVALPDRSRADRRSRSASSAPRRERPFEQLVATMLPSARTRPLELAPRIAPPSSVTSGRPPPSSSASPRRTVPSGTPPGIGRSRRRAPRSQLPQPDGVLVLPGASGPELVFLEHDRGWSRPRTSPAQRPSATPSSPSDRSSASACSASRRFASPSRSRTPASTVMPLERLGRLARLLRRGRRGPRVAVLSLAGWANAWPARRRLVPSGRPVPAGIPARCRAPGAGSVPHPAVSTVRARGALCVFRTARPVTRPRGRRPPAVRLTHVPGIGSHVFASGVVSFWRRHGRSSFPTRFGTRRSPGFRDLLGRRVLPGPLSSLAAGVSAPE